MRVGTAEMLMDLGYSVVQAGSGAEALGICAPAQFEIDIIVSDHLMPAMNGAEVLQRRARSSPIFPACW